MKVVLTVLLDRLWAHMCQGSNTFAQERTLRCFQKTGVGYARWQWCRDDQQKAVKQAIARSMRRVDGDCRSHIQAILKVVKLHLNKYVWGDSAGGVNEIGRLSSRLDLNVASRTARHITSKAIEVYYVQVLLSTRIWTSQKKRRKRSGWLWRTFIDEVPPLLDKSALPDQDNTLSTTPASTLRKTGSKAHLSRSDPILPFI